MRGADSDDAADASRFFSRLGYVSLGLGAPVGVVVHPFALFVVFWIGVALILMAAALEKAVVPAGPINTVADLFRDPQFVARNMRIDPQGTPGVRSPIWMSRSGLSLKRRAPRLDEHRAEILREIGLDGSGAATA